MSTVITGRDDIGVAQMIARKHALHLEVLGMTRRGRSVYSIVKEQHGLKGSKAKVYEQYCAMVEKAMQERKPA